MPVRDVEEAAALQVLNQAVAGLIDVFALHRQAAIDVRVRVPIVVIDLHETDTSLRQPTGHQCRVSKRTGLPGLFAVKFERRRGFALGASQVLTKPVNPDDLLAAVASVDLNGQRPGARVLVVDDNRDAADSLAQLLELLGANASVAYGGEEALNAMLSSPPRVAFVDIGMPGMNGYQVASTIRATDTLAGTILIALTGWGQATDRERILSSGFDHHLIKPADIQTLTQLLNSFA